MSKFSSLCIVLILASLQQGCTNESGTQTPAAGDADHKHANEAIPESFESATAQLIRLRNTIRDGFAAGDVDAAHGPLHDVGHLLEQLPELARDKGLDAIDLESVTAATEALFEAFGAVDKTLHGGDGSTYEEEANKIDSNVKIVADLAGVEVENSATATANSTTEPADSIQPIDAIEPVDAAAPTAVPAPEPQQ
jgi:hypothetical protein